MIRRTFILALAIMFIFLSGRNVFAISSTDQQRINTDTEYYDANQNTACSSSQVTSIQAGSGSPDGATFPNLNPASMASAINTYIKDNYPSGELNGLGATIVADAKNSNVSPFIVVGIAQNETGEGSPTAAIVTNANNSFGREAGDGQLFWQGTKAKYYKWTPYTNSAEVSETGVEASVDYTAPENQNITGGGDIASYLRFQYGAAIDASNLLAFFEAYDKPTGNGANIQNYITNIDNTMTALINLTTGGSSATPNAASSTPTAGVCGCSTTSSSSQSTIDFTDAKAAAQAATGIQVGLAVSDSSGNITDNYNGDVPEYGASITKAMLLVAYLNQDGGVVPTGAEDTQLTGMIEQSDNADANATYKQVGGAAVKKVASDAGMTKFTLDTSDPDYVLGQSLVTADDQAMFFAKINSLIPASQLSYAQNLFSHLSSTDAWGILAAKLPATIYSKAGWKQELPSNNWVVNQAAQVVPTGQAATSEVGVAMVTFGSTTQVAGEQLLQDVFTKLFSTLSGNTSCGGGGSIVQTALSLAWPIPYSTSGATSTRPLASTPTPAYVAAMEKYNPSEYTATDETGGDCGVFVATVMHASGADPNYPDSYTVAQAEYVIAHPNLYKVIYPATSTSQLQPGDILIINSGTTEANGVISVGQGGGGAGGHTFIYLGPQGPKGYSEANASYDSDYVNKSTSGELNFTSVTGDSRGSFLIARLIQ